MRPDDHSERLVVGPRLRVVIFVLRLYSIFICPSLTISASVQDEPFDSSTKLFTAREVLSLSDKEASLGKPVKVIGVVTLSDPSWSGEFFIQDDTAGIFINNLAGFQTRPSLGDLLEVSGRTNHGAFAPIIDAPSWRTVGRAPLPAAKVWAIDELLTGSKDGQRSQIDGWVHRVHTSIGRTYLDVALGVNRIEVWLPLGVSVNPASLIGSRIKAVGVPTAKRLAPDIRRIDSVQLWIARAQDFGILVSPGPSPLTQPPISIAELPDYRIDANPGRRYHLHGVITYRTKNEIYMSDQTGGIELRDPDASEVRLGTVVDAVGFLVLEHGTPVLVDGEIFPTSIRSEVTPQDLPSLQEMKEQQFNGRLVRVKGKLINFLESDLQDDQDQEHITALVQTAVGFVTAEIDVPRTGPASDKLEPNSIIQIVGVCKIFSDQQGIFETFKVLVPSLNDVVILEHPSPFTTGRLLVVLSVLSIVLVVIIVRSNVLIQKNARLEGAVLERNAVLAERARLAGDLHDTLEQVLTGVSLQIQTAQKLFSKDMSRAQTHINIAYDGIRQTHGELRRSIWNLTPAALEQFDLFEALSRAVQSTADASHIECECKKKGSPVQLDPVVEENLLRIGQEAVVNISKHARAKRIELMVTYSTENLVMEILDDGVGFSDSRTTNVRYSGFGLSNMRERAERVGGSLEISGRLPRGTRIFVVVPYLHSGDTN